MRWTSSTPPRLCTRSRSDSTISGPIVIGGTKCPSITSTWMTRAPASITSSTCRPSRAKSADRIDGATRTSDSSGWLTPPHASARRREPACSGLVVVGRGVLGPVLEPVVDLVERGDVPAEGSLAVVVDLVELVGQHLVAAVAAVDAVDLAVSDEEAVA